MSLFSTPQQPQQQQPSPFQFQNQAQQQQPSPFQFQNQPQQQQQQQQPSPFQFPNQPQQQQQLQSSPFQFQNQPQQQPSPFQFQNQPQQQQSLFPQQLQQQQQQLQQLFFFTNDRAPASYSTKWADLHPDSQKVLLQIEEKILEYRDESQRLDQCTRLSDSSVSTDSFEIDDGHVVQKLGGISNSLERQKVVLQELMTMVKGMLRNTEVAVRSFMMLQPRFLHLKGGAVSNAIVSSQAPAATNTPAAAHPQANSLGHVVEFYSGLPMKPSIFMQQKVSSFEKYLGECRQWIEELEQLTFLNSEQNLTTSNSLLQSLPKLMSNMHDFFVHVAAKVESIHQYTESMRAAYLVDQRRRGEGKDPFLEADRRETARREAAAKRVHPTLHLPALPQPSTETASSVTLTPSGSSTAPRTSSAALPSSTGSGFSLFGPSSSTPSAPASSSALFATPTSVTASSAALFATPASAPSSSPFAASGASPETPFPNFAPSTSTPLFTGNAASFGPSATGGAAATGSGVSIGTARARPKPRTARR